MNTFLWILVWLYYTLSEIRYNLFFYIPAKIHIKYTLLQADLNDFINKQLVGIYFWYKVKFNRK